MKRNIFIPLLLCLTMCFSIVGCEKKDNTPQSITVSYLDANKKVMLEEDYVGSNTLSIYASIGEYEAGQILMSPKKDVKSYDITLNNLTSEQGNVYDKANIILYNQKYINCKTASAGKDLLPTGYIPDALLPFETAKKYKENTIKGGQNQTIYVSFKIPYGQEPGVYTGTFVLNMDGQKVNVPVRVEVASFEMSKDVHLQSYYNTRLFYLCVGELSGSFQTSQAYMDKLHEFRITSPTILATTPNGFEDTVSRIRELCADDKEIRLSTIHLSLSQVGNDINRDVLTERVLRLCEVSIEDGKNYLEKVILRPGIFDEPFATTSKIALIKNLLPKYYEWRDEVVEVVKNNTSIPEGELKDEIVKSISIIPCLITTYEMEELVDVVKSYCVPAGHAFGQEHYRQFYKNAYEETGEIQWMYSCASDSPGFKIDSSALNLRVMGWMCHEVGFRGTLNWENSMYQSYEGTKINPYEFAKRSASTNGDGYIFYPGKPYGLKEPVTTLRIHAIRDGYEDYEWFYLLDELYKENGYSPKQVLSALYKNAYKDNYPTKDVELFANTRYALGQLIELAKQGVFVTSMKETASKYVFNIVSTNNSLSKVNGVQVQAGESTFECSKTANKICTLSVESTSGTVANIYLCGKVEEYKNFNSASILSDCSIVDNAGNLSLVDFDNEKVVKVDFNQGREFGFKVDTKVNSKLESLKLHVYSDLDKDMLVDFYIKGSGGKTIAQDFLLKKGWNVLTVTFMNEVKWDIVRKIDSVSFRFDEEVTGSVYVNDFSLVKGA